MQSLKRTAIVSHFGQNPQLNDFLITYYYYLYNYLFFYYNYQLNNKNFTISGQTVSAEYVLPVIKGITEDSIYNVLRMSCLPGDLPQNNFHLSNMNDAEVSFRFGS